jgi:NitT/TauT family transport system substrate-binding protein
MLPAWIAQDEGLFQKHGLDVELSYIAGAVKVGEALLAGELDVGVAAASTAMGPGLEGADLAMIACWTTKLSFSMLSPATIQTPADLRGKRVGVSRRGSNSEIWAAAVLAPFGLEPERGYSILSIGGQAEQLAALQNGAVDAAVLAPPGNLLARRLGFHELLSYQDHGLEYATVGLVTSRRYLQDHSGTVDRLLRASAEGVAVMSQQRDTALAVLARYSQVDDPTLLEETLAFELTRTAREMVPTSAGLRAALAELASNNPKAATADPEAFVALDPIRRLNAEGFIRGLYP